MATSRVTKYFPCPVERVWQVVTDLSHTAWRSDLKRASEQLAQERPRPKERVQEVAHADR